MIDPLTPEATTFLTKVEMIHQNKTLTDRCRQLLLEQPAGVEPDLIEIYDQAYHETYAEAVEEIDKLGKTRFNSDLYT